jgi:hypothetical protein
MHARRARQLAAAPDQRPAALVEVRVVLARCSRGTLGNPAIAAGREQEHDQDGRAWRHRSIRASSAAARGDGGRDLLEVLVRWLRHGEQ